MPANDASGKFKKFKNDRATSVLELYVPTFSSVPVGYSDDGNCFDKYVSKDAVTDADAYVG